MEKFINQFETKVKSTIQKYKLATKTDKIIVACSGGKDSTTALYLLNKFGYKVKGLIIDLLIGTWSKDNLKNIEQFSETHEVKLSVVSMRKEFGCSVCYIRSIIQSKTTLKNCTICGVIKRWLLNKKAREWGATKLATGHNLDDEAETILMNILNGSPKLSVGLGPKTGVIKDKRFVQRIKPLYFCSNQEIKKYSELMNFPVLYNSCPCSANTFRREIRNRLAQLEKKHPGIKENMVNNFLELLPELRKYYKTKGELKNCKICKEPSRNEVCKTCEMLKILRAK